MPEKITRPERRQVTDTLRALTKADTQLQRIVTETDAAKAAILQAYDNLRRKGVGKVLEGIGIEELNRDKLGIRVSVLKGAGYANIGQLHGVSPYRLVSINGIGEETAGKIARKVQELALHAQSLVKVRLDAKDKNSDANEIVTRLAALLQTRQITERAGTLHANHAALAANLAEAKKLRSGLRWAFTSQKKKGARVDMLAQLEHLVDTGFADEAQALNEAFTKTKIKPGSREAWAQFEANNAPFYALLEQVSGSTASQKTFVGLPAELVQAVEAFPLDMSLMKATLRSYQVFGTKYLLHQNRTLLGDEMGLGKTMQAIAAMAHLAAQGKRHFVVVAPVSVMINWMREIAQHSALEPVKLYGDYRQQIFDDWLNTGGVAVTTYETISRLQLPENFQIDMLTVDEAHYVKNPEAIRTKALMKFTAHSDGVVFMTGTPLENKVDEMVFLLGMLNREVSQQIAGMLSLASAPEFRQTVAPVYLRRVREDVLTELPDKTEKEDWCIMTPAEEATYKRTLRSGNAMLVRQVSWNTPNLADSSKAARLQEICTEAEEDGRKIIVFSFFLDTIRKIQGMFGEKCYGPINGSVPANRRQEIVDEFTAAPPGSVLVCQIIAGGVGLNIQSASVVVLCEPQWKPSTENQAISRVYRMGQSKNVMVHRLLADETVDERILEILRDKSATFDAFADESAVDEAAKTINEGKAMASIMRSEREKYGLEETSSPADEPASSIDSL